MRRPSEPQTAPRIAAVERLQKINFIDKPQDLVKEVKDTTGCDKNDKKSKIQLLGRITAAFMNLRIETKPPQFPLTPHHTQALIVLMFAIFYECKERGSYKTCIAQMSTGEGKSIVIMMLAAFLALYNPTMNVHVLENNDTLLQRDYKSAKPLYDKLGLSSADKVDPSKRICYCTKRTSEQRFIEMISEGKLDLSKTFLIVDEVDGEGSASMGEHGRATAILQSNLAQKRRAFPPSAH